MAALGKLILTRAHLQGIEQAARTASPREACGMLIGRRQQAGWRVLRVEPSKNVAPADQADRFEVDPVLLLRLHKELRGGAESMIGVYHSHPNGVCAPSATDLAQSWQAGMIWLISALSAGVIETRGFVRGQQGFTPVLLEILEAAP